MTKIRSRKTHELDRVPTLPELPLPDLAPAAAGEEEETIDSAFVDLVDSVGEVKAYLIVLSGTGPDRVVRLGRRTIVGRGTQADLFIEDPSMSRTHACLYEDPQGKMILSDLGSQNGSFVNGTQVQTATLSDGDKLRLGSTMFKFTISYPLE